MLPENIFLVPGKKKFRIMTAAPQMLNSEQDVQECDATDDDSSNAAGNKRIV
jgi:hypothetical protein